MEPIAADFYSRRNLAKPSTTSDNGPENCIWQVKKEYGHDGAASLRGMKRDNWEGGHRVPFVARWPGKIKPGTTSGEVLCLTDLMATAAAIVGAELPDGAGEDSYNMLPALLGKRPDRPINYSRARIPIQPPITRPDAPGQLYDLSRDLGETKNLYKRHPEVVRRLSELLEKYKREGRSRRPG